MNARNLVFACGLLLAGCANMPIPLSTTDPPPPNAQADNSCMQDCLADNAEPGLCHERCAK